MKNPGIFLAAPESTSSLQHEHVAPRPRPALHLVARPDDLPAQRLDLGLWLLAGAARRSAEWQRLDMIGMAGSVSQRPMLLVFAVCKRVVDIIGSLLLIVLLLPVFVLIALLIAVDSGGPIFFRQHRIGKDGRRFLLWKFRSMHVDAPRYAVSPIFQTDPRMTRVGRLIRRISVDELPQLINVLWGDMSLVGPRPEMPFLVARYTAEQRRRLAVKPGITGLWQISSGRAHPIHENLQYDVHYIQHRNPVLDTAILLRTLTVVLRGAGTV
jgi:lipopolysaccharide/colanic/teichoic acid biosynthesis glycosyltransferase